MYEKVRIFAAFSYMYALRGGGVTGPVSWWMADAGGGRSRPPLGGAADVDVAIMGAGFTGLWTAWWLQQLDPDLRIGIVEAEHAGFGASGRNGGWCTAGLSVTWSDLARRHGRDAARRTAEAMRETVGDIGAACEAASEGHGIDAAFRRSGLLRIARGDHELAALHTGWQARVDLGLDDGSALLDVAELAARVRVAEARGAIFDGHGATVHPGRLVTGLARAVERRGATIWEGTRVSGWSGRRRSRRRPVLRTDAGEVTADTVVLAGEAYMSQLAPTHRRVLPVYSLIVLTEPLTDRQRQAVGWEGGECLSSHRHTVDYLSITDDGRILFGGRGAPYHYGSGIDPSHDHHRATHDGLRRQLLEWFPDLDGIGFTAAWGGAVGLSRDWMPTITANRRTGVATAMGYGGQGVATSHLAGRVLAHQITGTGCEWDDLPIVGRRLRRWEPEPVRWAAVRYLQTALARIDARAAETGRAPTGRSLAERLTRH